MNTRSTILAAAVYVATVLTVSACGATVSEPSRSSGASTATVTNCHAPLTVPGTPTRAMTNDTGITEMMFALGLQARMVGYTTYDSKKIDIDSSPWRSDFGSVRSLGTAFTREVVQHADPDFVFAGWNYGFKESTGVTPDWIRSIGATPYQLTEACRQPGTTRRGIERPLDALYDDLTNLGTIFGVRARATTLVQTYRAEVARAAASAPTKDGRARVLVFDSADPAPFTAGHNAAPDEIISQAGGDNVFADLDDSWTSVSWEAAARDDPQVIVIVDYPTGPSNTVQSKIDTLRAQPLMSQTTAVRQGNIVAFPYAALVESPRNPATITALAQYLRSKGF
ncbi:ABC transporter substrate-binding protein [Williamsia sterculiae]|uniref:Iron complex transport system substrate-binding protein n=1 Tax=Williamsia sterculiae TaxID=1344003 RepID=A0A1N7H1Q9_9NOCA|nr:ABC transporter substrate-binding protein [Williamsia sterculiae]SIS18772.1 iron complex transport system substrate-binding protein [Williamsia sterculiae]